MQLLICGVLCLIPALIIEKPSIEAILKNIWPLLYLGVFSNAIADFLQVHGQNNSKNPTLASIIMSTESVFALISGVIILKDSPKINEILGCVVMFAAIIISQIEFKKKDKTLSQ